MGQAGLVAGSGFLYLSVYILRFAFVGVCGFTAIWFSIQLILAGSILWGILALLIGTPLVIGISSYFFPVLLGITIVSAIIWGCTRLVGGEISFSNIWSSIWLSLGWLSSFSR